MLKWTTIVRIRCRPFAAIQSAIFNRRVRTGSYRDRRRPTAAIPQSAMAGLTIRGCAALLHRISRIRFLWMINVANDNTPNRHVAYAGRYASGPVNKFNAFSALERARLLLRETEQIMQMFELEGEKDERADWWWNGFEIVPYTLVGLATCLEWHARSRLTDAA